MPKRRRIPFCLLGGPTAADGPRFGWATSSLPDVMRGKTCVVVGGGRRRRRRGEDGTTSLFPSSFRPTIFPSAFPTLFFSVGGGRRFPHSQSPTFNPRRRQEDIALAPTGGKRAKGEIFLKEGRGLSLPFPAQKTRGPTPRGGGRKRRRKKIELNVREELRENFLISSPPPSPLPLSLACGNAEGEDSGHWAAKGKKTFRDSKSSPRFFFFLPQGAR